MQREDEADRGNEPGTNSSESAVNHLSKSVVRDTEGAAKQKPHATFCGNRGWATAPGDPVKGGQDLLERLPGHATLLASFAERLSPKPDDAVFEGAECPVVEDDPVVLTVSSQYLT